MVQDGAENRRLQVDVNHFQPFRAVFIGEDVGQNIVCVFECRGVTIGPNTDIAPHCRVP